MDGGWGCGGEERNERRERGDKTPRCSATTRSRGALTRPQDRFRCFAILRDLLFLPSFSSLLVACWPHDRRTSLALETIRISQGCLCVCRVDRCMVRGSVRTASRDSQEHRSLEEDSITERLLRYHRARAMVVRAAWVAAFPSQAPPILMTSSMSSTLACSRRVWIV